METPNSLPEDAKLRIRLEQMYRNEIKKDHDSSQENKSTSNKLWIFLNSTIGIWFLSTCVVGLITFWYTRQQEIEQAKAEEQQAEIEDARNNATLVTVLLPYMASPEEKQWRLAIEITKYLKLKGKLPGELESALIGIVQTSDSLKSDNQQGKISAAAAIIDINTNTELAAPLQSTSLPPRVYIQIPNESRRELAKSIQRKLKQESFIVPGIENVSGKAGSPNQTQVRYYRDEERDEALKLINIIKTLDPNLKVSPTPQKIAGHERTTRARHYELWIGK